MIFRPDRYPLGSCVTESLTTWMWSAAVLEPALPGRSKVASGSPVPRIPWSRKEHNGWNPKPFFHVGRASSFSEWEVRRDASRSMTSGFSELTACRGESLPACAHTWARAVARAHVWAASALAGLTVESVVNSRLMVGSEATSPYTSGCCGVGQYQTRCPRPWPTTTPDQ